MIFDVNEHDGQPFIAMEYLEGETLDALIRRRAPSSAGRKIQLMDELCAGLEYAHRHGIVHGDISPKHVMVDADGVVKILNFGTAHLGDLSGGLGRGWGDERHPRPVELPPPRRFGELALANLIETIG